jgi:hypothetical protein
MAGTEIMAGEMYLNVKGFSAREVVTIVDGDVLYAEFGFPDGKPFGRGRCSLYYFQKWAARPLSPAEADTIRDVGVPVLEQRYLSRQLEAIATAPDEMLEAECVRRGLLGRWLRRVLASDDDLREILSQVPSEAIAAEHARRQTSKPPRRGRG